MESNRFFIGTVTSSDAGTFNALIEPKGYQRPAILQGVQLAGVFASALGFKESSPLPVGATVFCYQATADLCFVIGIVPDHDIANFKFFGRSCLDTADSKMDEQNCVGYNNDNTKKITHNNSRPTDVVEGEKVIGNDLGVMLGLFQSMAVLKGSELSQVKCFLFDDLVRIISHNFQHFTALGELNIFHDGKTLSAEYGATHLSQEALGAPTISSSSYKPFSDRQNEATIDDSMDYFAFDEKIKAIERIKVYLGRIGDLVHIFLSRPDENSIRKLGEFSKPFDKGLFDIHLSPDGRFTLRTVHSIAIEKTNWIAIPHRVYSPEDPTGDDGETIEYQDKDPFQFDTDKKDKQDNPIYLFLQLRDCTTYLQEYNAYLNTRTHTKDFAVPNNPQDGETSFEDIDQIDPNTKVNFSDFKLRKAGLYFTENGGIVLREAGGAAIILEGGKIFLQPTTDLVLQPLRDEIHKIGRNVSICSKKDQDYSSTEGAIRLKADQPIYLYSANSGVILQSDSTGPGTLSDDDVQTDLGGIVLKSSNITMRADDTLFTRAKLNYNKSDSQYDEIMKEGYSLIAHSDINFICDKGINLLSNSSITVAAKNTANFAGGSTNIGKQNTIVGLVPHQGSFPVTLDGVLPINDLLSPISDFDNLNLQQEMTPFDSDANFDKLKFRFLKSDDYNFDEGDYIPMTLAQQDNETGTDLNLNEWTEKEVNGTLPYPGKDKFDSFYITCAMNNLQQIENDLASKDATGLTNSAQLNVDSLNNYKVM